MAKVDPGWSLDALLRDYHPHPSWRDWFAEAYNKALASAVPEKRLNGWKTAAIIFGDMHANVFCLFVCYHGQSLVPAESKTFQGHIDLCLWGMGLVTPTQPGEMSAVPVRDLGKAETFHRDDKAIQFWMAEQLQPFGGDVERAAVFAMRLTAVRFGLLRGPAGADHLRGTG